MNLHEYQAKELLRKFDIPLLNGVPVQSKEQIPAAISKFSDKICVVKAQIHAGGRGAGSLVKLPSSITKKQGGVWICKSQEEASLAANTILGNTLITKQTGEAGKKVNRIFIEEGCEIDSEYYLSLLIDRSSSKVCFVVSKFGGMNIEEVAEQNPKNVVKVIIDPATGVMANHANLIANCLGFDSKTLYKQIFDILKNLYKAFIELDASLIEINPLAKVADDKLIALDAKMSLDDSSLFRHADYLALLDESEQDPNEILADKHELNYIKLDGSIGCMVNGAGLAMATMDIIQLKGSSPANFLDVGGGATKERVAIALKIILSDPNVKVILVNIFGGIMRCDIIADGIISAVSELGLTIPLVVRLEGTNVEKGVEMLSKSGLAIISANNLSDAATKAVSASLGQQ